MDSHSIRRSFLSFFEEKGHTTVPSSSLIPTDPTLLLTVAGMVQFKPYLLGEEKPPYLRAASIQKSFRTEDIDIVGTTDQHLTFFEMLGNFSFGDYFKERAIPLAYEYVTERLHLDPELLWFTVYDTDDEAKAIWIDDVGVPPSRVQRGGRDNFWQMGVAGPCGPSSEIFYDRGAHLGDAGGPIGGSERRYVEIWNLVFMQNVQDEPYHVVGDLPARNIDTGAGLDRLALVLQNVGSVFENDILRPVLAAGEAVTGVGYGANPTQDIALRVLADHGRAVTFLIGDGVVPSNDGRGYIVRRVLRRAVRHAWALGAEDLITPHLIAATVDVMADSYPDLEARRDYVLEVAEREEVRFLRTLRAGQGLLETALTALPSGGKIPGATAFKLHDTYGFPVELTREIAAERGIALDEDSFESLMADQQARARAAWKGGEVTAEAALYRGLYDSHGPSDFLGYEEDEAHGRVLGIVREGELVTGAEAGQTVELVLDRTPFYAEAGGQVGDIGSMTTPTGSLQITDTRHGVQGLHVHLADVKSGHVQVGQDVTAAVDGVRRERIRKSHTGTHLLHWALRATLGDHAQQAGSLVQAGRLRFDFSHHTALAPEEVLEVERAANARVVENSAVTTVETTKQEAEAMGALAFFGDKYGERVRVVQAGDYSTEFCGGTHVPATGEIGPLLLTGESSIGANLRRVEALTGAAAYEHVVRLRSELESAAHALRAPLDGVGDAVDVLISRNRNQEARLAAFHDEAQARRAGSIAAAAEKYGDHTLVVEAVADMAPDQLRTLALAVRERVAPGVVIVGTRRDGKGSIVAAVSPALSARGVSAGEVIGVAARLMGGGGSRDPELAQAGGPDGDRLEEALDQAAAAARQALAAT